ncbi:MAG: hypothetical protein IH963_14385 [Chloroflexi bacterium]|nr:hypothetical protein [Chloroflexota bacterium]
MKKELIVGVISLLAIVGLACGGPNSTSTLTLPPTPTPTPTPTTPQPSACQEPTLEISVNGNEFKFDTERFEVAAGSDVAPCFDNVSTVSPHNWVLVKDGTKDQVAQRGLEAGAGNDFVQPGDPDVIAFVNLVAAGKTGEVRFSPPPPGTYQFVCTVPGHNFLMFGEFVVTP